MQLAFEHDDHLAVEELEHDLGIPKCTVLGISIDNLGRIHVCAKFLLKLLSEQQKEYININENYLKKGYY